ncbi:MAG TPA: 4a-hydroxytetrahydrobiopterin dehydratase [Candidatus Acidoferrales bacterium]|nr:4a-hydroxytetrahydrobiopterin dehydratase [Candidatus Acidoferrales bacterium]
MAGALSSDEVTKALANMPRWQFTGKAILCELTLKDFAAAMVLVNRVAEIAEQMNHHPDITIQYNRVGFQLWSHDAGGVTSRDLKLAQRIDELL